MTEKTAKAVPQKRAKDGTLRGGARAGAGREAGYRQPDRMRERIRVGAIILRENGIALGTIKIPDPAVEAIRQRARHCLLNKALPDLMRTEITGAEGGAMRLIIEVL